MKHNKVLLISFILIVAVGLASYTSFIDNKRHLNYDGYGLSFLCMFIIGVLGYIGWRKHPVKWPSTLWLLLYACAFVIIGSIILLNKFIFHWPAGYLRVVHQIRDVFNSPMPFLVLYILVRMAKPALVQNKAGF